jgi:NAD+ synthetase
MRIALAQINPTIGEIAGNTDLIRESIDRGAEAGAELVVFPELAVLGYPPKDLLLKSSVIDRCAEAIEDLARHCRETAAIIGCPARSSQPRGRLLHNAAAYCFGGQIQDYHYKSLLPTYDVFDEHRYFEPGPAVDLTSVRGFRLGISICEDLWNEEKVVTRQLYHDNPIDRLAARGAHLFVNAAASPYIIRKQEFRLRLMSHICKKNRLPLVYCNQVGGNDELIFDGGSCAFDANGQLIAHGKEFEQDLLVVELPLGDEPGAGEGGSTSSAVRSPRARVHGPTSPGRLGEDGTVSADHQPLNRIEPRYDDTASACEALVVGLRDYVHKCGFHSLVLGLSGGIDSAVSAALCVAAVGAENVRGITMPSRYSSEGSKGDSQVLADNLGITFHTIPIQEPHAAFESLLAPYFAEMPPDVTEENLQARIRGLILMAFSNKFGSLLVTTGNKSEVAVGYTTLYGDMAGGLALLSDVPKMVVYKLARWINDSQHSPLRQRFGKAVIPEPTIDKAPSAELRADQKDEDSLPPYDVLDPIIERYVEREQDVQKIIDQTGCDPDLVLRITRLIDRNEYKRKQMPPGLKITSRAFGSGRRLPIAKRFHNRSVAAKR